MLRLAIELDQQEDDFRAAASRIRNVAIVDEFEAAQAVVTDRDNAIPGSKPALWMMGEQPDAVFSALHPTGLEIFHLGFPGGGMAVLDFVGTLPDGERYRSLSLIGSRGAAYADDHRDRNLMFAGGAPVASPPDSTRAFVRPLLEDFAASVLGGRQSTEATRDHQSAVDVVRRARQSRS